MPFGVVEPCTRILGVTPLLGIQLLAHRVHDLKPFKAFTFRTFADVDRERIVQYPLALFLREVAELLMVDRIAKSSAYD